MKFFEPDSGTIKLDGVDLREYDTRFLRENIGIVFQENHIFNGTIADNIRYGNRMLLMSRCWRLPEKHFFMIR